MAASSYCNLLQTTHPVVLPQEAHTGLGRAGEHLCFVSHTSPLIAFGGIKQPCWVIGVCLPPLGERTEARVTFLFLPCSCWFTPPASHIPPLSAACLQKPSFILGNGEKSEPGLVATGTKPHLGWGETRGPTGGFSFPVNTQIVLVFSSSGRKPAGECKEKGARSGKVQMLVF